MRASAERFASLGGSRLTRIVLVSTSALILIGCANAQRIHQPTQGSKPEDIRVISYEEMEISEKPQIPPKRKLVAPPPEQKPQNTKITISVKMQSARIVEIYSRLDDIDSQRHLSESIWRSNPGTSELRDWETCEENLSKAEDDTPKIFDDLLTDLLGPKEAPKDAVYPRKTKLVWEYGQGLTRVRVTESGPKWGDRSIEIGTKDRLAYRNSNFIISGSPSMPNWQPNWSTCSR